MQDLLISKAKELGLQLQLEQANLLLEYLNILQQWNKIHNLCAKADLMHMLGYHLLDSLSVAAKINCDNKDILDVGTGAGLPGIPLAIVVPTAKFTLLDPRSKKMSFLTHVINKLNLKNIALELIRVENYDPINKFDLILSRGFSELKKFVELTTRLTKDPNSKIIAMKADPKEFIIGTEIFKQYTITEVKKIQVPLVTAKRCLVVVSNENLV